MGGEWRGRASKGARRTSRNKGRGARRTRKISHDSATRPGGTAGRLASRPRDGQGTYEALNFPQGRSAALSHLHLGEEFLEPTRYHVDLGCCWRGGWFSRVVVVIVTVFLAALIAEGDLAGDGLVSEWSGRRGRRRAHRDVVAVRGLAGRVVVMRRSRRRGGGLRLGLVESMYGGGGGGRVGRGRPGGGGDGGVG